MKNHLGRTNKDTSPCLSNSDENYLLFKKMCTDKMIAKVAERKERNAPMYGDDENVGGGSKADYGGEKKQTTMNEIWKPTDRKKCCVKISRFIYRCALPFNIVTNVYFKEMIGSRLKPPTYYEIRNTYLKKKVEEVNVKLESYKKDWKKYGCTIMSDGWTDGKSRSITNFLVNSPKRTVFSKFLDTSNIFHNAENLYLMLDEVVQKVGEENIIQVCTDSASAYITLKKTSQIPSPTSCQTYREEYTRRRRHCHDSFHYKRIRRTILDSTGNESTHSATIVASDDDLLREILFHLPVRSLLAFKSVSKKWLSLISDPYFTHNHSLRNYPTLSGIFLYSYNNSGHVNYPKFDFIPLKDNIGNPPFKSLTFIRDHRGVTIQQSCNGLLCCKSYRTYSSDSVYYICNPATKQLTTLPKPRCVTTKTSTSICSVSLAFDPLISPHYKVVCISMIGDIDEDYHYRIEIYYSKTASWKLCRDAFKECQFIFSDSGVFWNGALHWIIVGKSAVRFDANRELLSEMPMPNVLYEQEERRMEYFGASKYHIHLIERYVDKNQLYFLEMEIDYSKWNVKYRINLDQLPIAYPEVVRDYMDASDLYQYAFSVLAVQEDSSLLILHTPNKIISYGLKDNVFKMLKEYFSPGPKCYQMFGSFQYIETLACV